MAEFFLVSDMQEADDIVLKYVPTTRWTETTAQNLLKFFQITKHKDSSQGLPGKMLRIKEDLQDYSDRNSGYIQAPLRKMPFTGFPPEVIYQS